MYVCIYIYIYIYIYVYAVFSPTGRHSGLQGAAEGVRKTPYTIGPGRSSAGRLQIASAPLKHGQFLYAYMSLFCLIYISILLNKADPDNREARRLLSQCVASLKEGKRAASGVRKGTNGVSTNGVTANCYALVTE